MVFKGKLYLPTFISLTGRTFLSAYLPPFIFSLRRIVLQPACKIALFQRLPETLYLISPTFQSPHVRKRLHDMCLVATGECFCGLAKENVHHV